MITTYNVISEDGFIARQDGSEDFIPDELWSRTLEFFCKFDILIMGRKTYDALQRYDQKLLNEFENIKKIKKGVVTKDINFIPKDGYEVFHSPEEAVKSAQNVLVSSGPELNTFLLRNKLIDEVRLWKLPGLKIGTGIPAFYDYIGGAYIGDVDKYNLIKEKIYIRPYSKGPIKD